MWLKLLTSEDKEKLIEVASSLRQIGAKVELREVVEWEREEKFVVSGKLSELKKHKDVEIAERAEEWEKRIEFLREIFAKGEVRYEELVEKFLSRENLEGYESLKKLLNSNFEDFVDKAEKLLRVNLLIDELEFFLQRNRFEVGEVVKGEIPEDPEISILAEHQIEGSKKLVMVNYFPSWELAVDVMSVLGKEVNSRELKFLEIMISNILFNLEKVNDMDKLREFSKGIVEEENEEILINCEEIFDLIVKSLEKSRIVRVSGKKIKIRER